MWLKLGIVKSEIMLCETLLNLSTLRIKDIDELRARILTAWDKMDQRITDKAVSQWQTRLHACINAKGGYFNIHCVSNVFC